MSNADGCLPVACEPGMFGALACHSASFCRHIVHYEVDEAIRMISEDGNRLLVVSQRYPRQMFFSRMDISHHG